MKTLILSLFLFSSLLSFSQKKEEHFLGVYSLTDGSELKICRNGSDGVKGWLGDYSFTGVCSSKTKFSGTYSRGSVSGNVEGSLNISNVPYVISIKFKAAYRSETKFSGKQNYGFSGNKCD